MTVNTPDYTNPLATDLWVDSDWYNWFERPRSLWIDMTFNDSAKLPASLDQLLVKTWDDEAFVSLALSIARECRDYDNPYHNMVHGLRVMHNGARALEIIQRQLGVKLRKGIVQTILLALLAHDLKHPGKTFFADVDPEAVPNRIPRGIVAEETAVEWYSAALLDIYLANAGATFDQRQLAMYIVWASAYGAHAPQGQKLGVDKVRPQAILGTLMRAADVTIPADPVTAFNVEMAVNIAEGGNTPDLETMIAGRYGFLGYIASCLNALDTATGHDTAEVLGWRAVLDQHHDELDKLNGGNSPSSVANLVIAKAFADQYDVVL